MDARWHKTTEELPQETCEVLVCWRTSKGERKWTQLAMFYTHPTGSGSGWFEEDDDEEEIYPDYWMNIPQLEKI